MKKLISASTVRAYRGGETLYVDKETSIITPEALDIAKRIKVNIEFGKEPEMKTQAVQKSDSTGNNMAKDNSDVVAEVTKRVAEQLKELNLEEDKLKSIVEGIVKKECAPKEDPMFEFKKDSSGLKVIRGESIKIGRFEDAGEGKNVGLTDIITHHDGSTMAAGMMSWKKEDSFPWTLTYDEVDYIIDGELAITINGKTYEGKKGDVFFIPKGSEIIFGTPSSVKLIYVTYPANWAENN